MLRKRRLLQGNEACAEAALVAGCRFYAGYPITPSSEIAEFMSRRLPGLGGTYVQMEDEISSMAALIGASLSGAKAMTATSGPGFSLMQENLGYASLAEVPAVIVNVQRVGPSTGMPTLPAQGDVMQARWGTHGDHPIVVLAPASVSDYYYLTIEAFNIAEELRVPVVLLSDEVVAHMREVVEIPAPEELTISDRVKPTVPPEQYKPYALTDGLVPPMACFGDGYLFHVTGLYHGEDGFPTNDPRVASNLIRRIHDKLDQAADRLALVKEFLLDDAEVAVVAYGSPARAAESAVKELRAKGVRAGVLQLQCLWPFPAHVVSRLAERVSAIVVPEMNLGQLVGEVERAAAGRVPVTLLPKVGGELFTPDEIRAAIEEVCPCERKSV
ncbi:MAG TPA: 2-oxoacid:acceptor oxidoreductase subunit alpha [Symbiobacteriaceae bacterium]|nr:2-oxoacid:acceptor oxidoreductase subunit alpha [Symbiobacteriaceae bacterium]